MLSVWQTNLKQTLIHWIAGSSHQYVLCKIESIFLFSHIWNTMSITNYLNSEWGSNTSKAGKLFYLAGFHFDDKWKNVQQSKMNLEIYSARNLIEVFRHIKEIKLTKQSLEWDIKADKRFCSSEYGVLEATRSVCGIQKRAIKEINTKPVANKKK